MHYFLLFCFLFAGCASRIHHQILPDYSAGNFHVVEAKMTQCIELDSNDKVLLYLNRGMTRFANGQNKEAIVDFKCAIESIDYYSQKLLTDTIGQILLDDASAPYQGDDFEQTLARLYFALVLLANNDENNACAILRQSEEMDQKKRLAYSSDPITANLFLHENRIQKALFSYLLEKRGDRSNATLLRNQLDVPLPAYDPEKALLIILCHNGLAPLKISSFCPASIASQFVLERILEGQGVDPALCATMGIAIPELCSPLSHFPIPLTFHLGTHHEELQTFCEIGFLAEQELRQKMPCIAAKALARILLRRALVGYVQEKDQDLGTIADLSMFAVNALTKADTRSWSTLPMTIDAAFLQLESGTHTLDLKTSLHDYILFCSSHNLNLQKGDICVLNVFNLRPGVTKVLIPNKFKDNLCSK